MFRRSLVLLALVACAAPANDASSSADDLTQATPGVDLTSIDRSIDPCQDFYQFACGGYIARPLDSAITNPTYLFGRRAFLELQVERDALFEQIVTETPHSPAQAKAASVYRACQTAAPADTIALAAAVRADVEAVNDPTSLARIAARLGKLGGGPLVSVYLGPMHGLLEPQLWVSAPWKDYADPKILAQHKGEIAFVLASAFPELTPDEVARIQDSTIAIENALRFQQRTDTRMLDEDPYDAARLAKVLPAFDWATYFGTLGLDYVRSPGAPINGLARVVEQPNYAQIRDYLIANVASLATQQAWGFADTTCKNELGQYLGRALEPRFMELAGVDALARAKARDMFERIKRSWDAEIDEAAFLDDQTRAAAHLKLSHTMGQIGASADPDDLADFEPTGTYPEIKMHLAERSFEQKKRFAGQAYPFDFETSPHVVEAWADQQLNRFEVPGGMLGGFFFSGRATKFANLSGIGITFGHEIGHEFDDSGRFFDAFGDYGNSWWSEGAEKRIKALQEQLVAEYNAAPVPELPGATVDGMRTLGENMADNAGVKVAYRAAMEVSSRAGDVGGFSPAQQFFLAHAQSYCSKLTTEQFAQMLPSDPHAPPRTRINMTLANFDKFQEAFSCESGTPMAPTNRVVIW